MAGKHPPYLIDSEITYYDLTTLNKRPIVEKE